MLKKLALLFAALTLTLSQGFAKPVNEQCPVKGRMAKDGKIAEFPLNFCCKKCQAKFEKSPKDYIGELEQLEEGTCVVSGKKVDKKVKSKVQVAVCCGGCKDKFEENPSKYFINLK
ncbi:MAG: hypothetical protein ACQKBY_02950 [Verrucomicrobiales bacterium]